MHAEIPVVGFLSIVTKVKQDLVEKMFANCVWTPSQPPHPQSACERYLKPWVSMHSLHWLLGIQGYTCTQTFGALLYSSMIVHNPYMLSRFSEIIYQPTEHTKMTTDHWNNVTILEGVFVSIWEVVVPLSVCMHLQNNLRLSNGQLNQQSLDFGLLFWLIEEAAVAKSQKRKTHKRSAKGNNTSAKSPAAVTLNGQSQRTAGSEGFFDTNPLWSDNSSW